MSIVETTATELTPELPATYWRTSVARYAVTIADINPIGLRRCYRRNRAAGQSRTDARTATISTYAIEWTQTPRPERAA